MGGASVLTRLLLAVWVPPIGRALHELKLFFFFLAPFPLAEPWQPGLRRGVSLLPIGAALLTRCQPHSPWLRAMGAIVGDEGTRPQS